MPDSQDSLKTSPSSSSKEPSNSDNKLLLYQKRLSVLFGSASCIAGFICLLAMSSSWGFLDEMNPNFQITSASFASAIFASLAAYIFARSIAMQRGFQLLPIIVVLYLAMTASTILIYFCANIPLAMPLFLSTGYASGALLIVYWFPYICYSADSAHILQFVTRIFLIAIIIAAIFIFLASLFLPIVTAFLFAITIACGAILYSKYNRTSPFEESLQAETPLNSMIDIRSTIMLGTVYFQFGLCLGIAQSFYEAAAVLMGFVLGFFILFLDYRNSGVITEGTLRPISTSLPVISILFLCSSTMELRLIALFVLAGITSMCLTFGFSAIGEHSRICKLNPAEGIAKANAIDFTTLCVGIITGFLIVHFNLYQNPTHYISLILASIVCVVINFFNKNRYPDKTMLTMGIDPKKLEKSTLQNKCCILAEKVGLSPRQQEVLELLVVGRNARYIADHLTISQNTAQTHIRAIYLKLDVHNHQELMDKVMGTHIYNED